MIGGVRAPVWIGLGISGALLAAALGSMWQGGANTPAAHRPKPSIPAPRPAARLVPPFSIGHAVPDTKLGQAPARPSPPKRTVQPAPDAPASDPPVPERTPDLIGLEREATDAAESGDLLDRDEVEARLAKLRRAPGESPRDFAERVDAVRDRIWSDELLVQSKLAELYGSGTYPEGFPIDSVVAQERQMVEQMPPEDRAERLRIVLDVFEPHRPAPELQARGPDAAGEDAPGDL